MSIQSFKELIVWQKSIELVREIYTVTDSLPKTEIFTLTSQIRRAAISIPANIAEGYNRRNRKEYRQFLHISFGSAAELETHIVIAKSIYKNSDFKHSESLLEEVQKILHVMLSKLSL